MTIPEVVRPARLIASAGSRARATARPRYSSRHLRLEQTIDRLWPAIARDGLIVVGGESVLVGVFSFGGSTTTADPDVARLLLAAGVASMLAGLCLVLRVAQRFVTAVLTGLAGSTLALVLADITSMSSDARDAIRVSSGWCCLARSSEASSPSRTAFARRGIRVDHRPTRRTVSTIRFGRSSWTTCPVYAIVRWTRPGESASYPAARASAI